MRFPLSGDAHTWVLVDTPGMIIYFVSSVFVSLAVGVAMITNLLRNY